ncbi:MAG: hypothetical protein HN356_09110 [Calditrichaeota bacterium]|nr:hypothetical protein [Calditrichota bacterium]MBT7618962.1 hypothetical protein [Calditrichota bacterium]MBT7787791.1 hypothetical protein [Calditrichota bacterium]
MIEKYKYNTLKEVPDSAVNIEIQILNPSSNKAKEMNREGKFPEQAFIQIIDLTQSLTYGLMKSD